MTHQNFTPLDLNTAMTQQNFTPLDLNTALTSILHDERCGIFSDTTSNSKGKELIMPHFHGLYLYWKSKQAFTFLFHTTYLCSLKTY